MTLVGCVSVGVDGNTFASLEGDPILAQLIEPPRLYKNRARPIRPVLPKAIRKISFRQILMITAFSKQRNFSYRYPRVFVAVGVLFYCRILLLNIGEQPLAPW